MACEYSFDGGKTFISKEEFIEQLAKGKLDEFISQGLVDLGKVRGIGQKQTLTEEQEVNQVAEKVGISPKNLKDLYDINRKLFGLDRLKSLAAAITMDRMIGVMAKRANISKAEMYSKLNFQKASEQDLPQGIKFQVDAFHGSPYEFDKFTTQKIGTGEGAQAFGWGLYFTDLESIAKGYAEKLAKAKYDAKSFGEENIGIANRAILNIESTGSVDNAIKFLKDLIEKNKNGDTSKTKEILDFIEKNKDKFTVSKTLYKVSLHEGKTPEQYNWLVWDKTVGEKIASKIPISIRRKIFDFNEEKLNEAIDKASKPYKVKNKQLVSVENIKDFYEKLGFEGEKLDRLVANRIKSGATYFAFVLEESLVSPSEFFQDKEDAQKYLDSYKIERNEYLFPPNSIKSSLDIRNEIKKDFDVFDYNITGEELYKRVIERLTDSDYDRSLEWLSTKGMPSSRIASLFLLENGIDGIKYPAESVARGATSDNARGFNYVVFDENAVSIKEVIKFQKDAEKARGAVMVSMDGQATIYALTDPNVSTPVHELAHVFEHYLTPEERQEVIKNAGTKDWDIKTSEYFARGFEKYLANGNAPTEGLKKVFQKFKQWLTDIYNGIKDSDIDIELNHKMEEIYAKMLGEDAVKKKKTPPPTPPKQDSLADKARNKAAKLRSGEENVLPDWLRADLPKETKKQGASINEAYAAALETFADVYEKAQDFKKAVDEAFKKLSDWYNENDIDFDEKDLKEKFEAEMQGKKQDDADQERRFTKQMLATESLLPKAEITKTLEYVKQSNALSIEQATKIIDEIGVDEAFGLVVSGSDINGGVRGVLGQMLISKYNNLSKVAKTEADKEYYWDKTIEVADYVTKVLATEAGRMIQSFALWGRLTPEALIRSAIKDLQRQGEVFKKKAKKDVDNIGNKLAKANEEAVDEVLESNGLNAAIDNAEKKTKSKAAQKIKKIQDKRKSIIDKYKGKGGITFTSGGLTKEGIEFVGEMAKTYIEEGIANIQLMVEKIAENIKEISGKDATEDMLKQVKEIAEKKLSSSDIRLISKGLNDMKVKISEVVKKHFTEVESVKTTLAEKLVEEAGLEGEEATELANKIKDAFDRVATTKKNKILEDELERLKRAARKLNGTKEVTAKQLHDDIIRLTNLGGFNNTELLDLLAAKVGTGKLTQQEGARLQFLAERVRQAPEGSPKNDAIQDLLNYQANLKGASAGELSQAVWYASLLGGYKTQIKNIVANFFNTAVLTFTNIVENPKATKEILGGLARGWARGITEARHTLSTGKSPIHILKIEASNILERKRFKGKYNPMNVLKYVSRAMVAADVFAYQGLKESRSYQLAYAEAVKMKKKDALDESVWRIVNDKLLNTKERKAQAELIIEAEGLTGNEAKRRMYELMEQSRPEKMQDDSYNYAARGTYNYPPEGVLGALNNAISVALDIPIAGVKPLRFLVPFTRVLTNVANGALDFEPITSTRRAIRGKVGFEAFNSFSPTKGTYREMTPEEQKTQYVKAAIGIAALSLFYALSKMEDDEGEPLIEITGAGSSDYNKTNALRQRGWKPYSIKIGDKYYSYQLTPLILTLGWIGSLNDFEKYDAKDDTEVLEKMSQTAFRLQDIITDMSFMSGTADIFDNFFDNSRTRGKKVGDYLENLGKSSIPFMQPISQVSQTVQTYMGANQKETSKLGYDLVKDIPIARNYLYDKVNVLGEPIKLEKGIGELLVSTKKSSKAWDLLEKNGVFIAPIKRKTVMFYDTEKGLDLPATDEQFYNFSKLRGSLIKDWIEDLEDEGLYVIEDDAMVWKDWKQLNSGKYKKDVDSYIEDGTRKATEAAKETVLLNNKNEVDAAYWQRLKDKVKNENEKLKRYQQ